MISVMGNNKPVIAQKLLKRAEDFIPNKLIAVALQKATNIILMRKILLFANEGEIKYPIVPATKDKIVGYQMTFSIH